MCSQHLYDVYDVNDVIKKVLRKPRLYKSWDVLKKTKGETSTPVSKAKTQSHRTKIVEQSQTMEKVGIGGRYFTLDFETVTS